MTTKIFIDTEFTDLQQPQLISIALVCGKDYFYAECSNFDRSACSPFVRKEVLPQLGKGPTMPFDAIGPVLRGWLQKYLGPDKPVICFDNTVDMTLFERAGGRLEGIWGYCISDKIDSVKLENYYLYNYAVKHHALYDAFANQAACDALEL